MANHTGAHITVTDELDRAQEVLTFEEAFSEGSDVRDARVWERELVFGQYSIKEVLQEVKVARWQRERVRMLGTSHRFKWNVLRAYLRDNGFNRHSRCVVTNYVYALKRGGVIK